MFKKLFIKIRITGLDSRREKYYCHHEQPCWCGLPLDPKFKYELNLMGATEEDLKYMPQSIIERTKRALTYGKDSD